MSRSRAGAVVFVMVAAFLAAGAGPAPGATRGGGGRDRSTTPGGSTAPRRRGRSLRLACRTTRPIDDRNTRRVGRCSPRPDDASTSDSPFDSRSTANVYVSRPHPRFASVRERETRSLDPLFDRRPTMHVCTKRVLCEPALRVLGHHAEPHVPHVARVRQRPTAVGATDRRVQ